MQKITGSNIKVISQVAPDIENNDIFENIDNAIDYGADIILRRGNWCDRLMPDRKIDDIE